MCAAALLAREAGCDHALRQLEQAIKAAGTTTLPVEVWVDSQRYVRKLEYQSQASGQAADLTMEFHDFGSPVPITAPATNEVVDLLQALGGID